MGFALSPDHDDPRYNGLPRLIRFVPALFGRTVATLDHSQNLLVIDRRKFELLTDEEKEALIRTHSAETIFEEAVATGSN